jgi:hypothetical protein
MKYFIITTVLMFLSGCASNNMNISLNKHGVIAHACCEGKTCCGMNDCCDLKEKKPGEACKNKNCIKIINTEKK